MRQIVSSFSKLKNLSFIKILVDITLFVGPLIPMFWTSGDVYSAFQSQTRQPYSHLAEVYMLPVP